MAYLKCALNRKNASNTYDVLSPRTQSEVVFRPSGRTVEQDLAAYLPAVQGSDVVPNSLPFGKLSAGPNSLFVGMSDKIGTVVTDKNVSSYAMPPYPINDYATKVFFRIGDTVQFGHHWQTGAALNWIIADVAYGYCYELVLAADQCLVGEFDAAEPDNPANQWVQQYGNNRYRFSNARQWMNSTGAANSWFVKQHDYDVAPSYANQNGFLYNFTEAERNNIVTRRIVTQLARWWHDSGKNNLTEFTDDKVWLPAFNQVYGGSTARFDDWWGHEGCYPLPEGREIEYFKNPLNFCVPGRWTWMRSPVVDYPNGVWHVCPDGLPWTYDAYWSDHAVRPCISVKWGTI